MWFEEVTTACPISVEILHIYCPYGPQCPKMHLLLLQACKDSPYTEIPGGNSDFSFDFQHISGKHMFVSDFLSRFSSDNINDEYIPYYIMPYTCLSWMPYVNLIMTPVKGYVHLIHFLLQDLKPNFRKLQFQASLKPIQLVQEQL